MKNYKEILKIFKNKYKTILDTELKPPFKNSIFYKKTKSKIYNISKFSKEKIEYLFKKNYKAEFLKKDFYFISIYYSENELIISKNIETKNQIIVQREISFKIPGDIVDDEKILNFDSLIKILEDVISVLGNKEIPILLNLSSKFFTSKTFNYKELSSLNKNVKLVSSSPFIEENTTIKIKEDYKPDSNSFTKVVYSRKDIIASWVKVLSKLDNPKIGLSNGYLELIESILKVDSEVNSFIIADVGAFTTTLFLKNKDSEITSLNLPYGSDLYNSESDEIRIQYFNRLKNSIDNLKKENILGDKIKIYICGRGLYSINKFVQYLPNKLILIDYLFKENIRYEKNEYTNKFTNNHFHNQSYALIQNKNNLSFNFLENYSNINIWDPNKTENEYKDQVLKLNIFLENFKKSILKFKKQKILFYPTASVLFLTLLIWLISIPYFFNIIRFRNNHLKYQADLNQLLITKTSIEKNIDKVISFSSIYKSRANAYLFAKFIQEVIPEDVRISNYLLNKSGFRIEFISKNIDSINKLIKLLSTIPLIEENSLSINFIREIQTGGKFRNSKVIAELNGKIKNLSIEERLKYNYKFEDFGKYTKLRIFSDINSILGEK